MSPGASIMIPGPTGIQLIQSVQYFKWNQQQFSPLHIDV